MAHTPKTVNIRALRTSYRRLISQPKVSERAVHRFLVKHPVFIPVLWPYSNTVFTEFQLGNQKRVDFAFAREDSLGVRWHFIEIEKPWNRLFTRKGDPTKELSHALRQVQDWHTWFIENRYNVLQHFPFKRQMNEIGLHEPQFVLIIGRRKFIEDENRALARRFSEYPLDIMSFDRIGERIGVPWYNDSIPLRTCRFATGKITQLAAMKINITYSIV